LGEIVNKDLDDSEKQLHVHLIDLRIQKVTPNWNMDTIGT
jgi:hypothetical protein